MKFTAIDKNHLYVKAYRGGAHKYTSTVRVYLLKDKHRYLIMKGNPQKKMINRIGITASKKIGGAVDRNRAKRLIREALQQITREHPDMKTGYLLVIAAQENCFRHKMPDVKADLEHALNLLGVL